MAFIWEDESKDTFNWVEKTTELIFAIASIKVTLLFVGTIVAYFLNNKLLGLAVVLCTSLLVYFILKGFFELFWHSFNRAYGVSYDGIHFRWGLRREYELFVPYYSILHITHVTYNNSPYSTLYFDTTDPTILEKYPQLARDKSFKLSFDMISEGARVHALIDKLRKNVKVIEVYYPERKTIHSILPTWINKAYCFIAFLFLSFSFHTLASIIDHKLFDTKEVVTTITEQSRLNFYEAEAYEVKSEGGHKMQIVTTSNLVGTEVILKVSPLFSRVDTLEFPLGDNRHRFLMLSPLAGISLCSRVISIIAVSISALFILYRRGFISTEDLGLLFGFPAMVLFVTYFLFGLSYVN